MTRQSWGAPRPSSVAVVIPWSDGCPQRERALAWVRGRYGQHHPDWPVILGRSSPGPFNRSEAILEGVRHTEAEIIVAADGDVWCDGLADAVAATAAAGWAVPHGLIHRLSETSTDAVLAGADWRLLPLSKDNAQDRRPYRGHEAGTLLVLRRDVLTTAPPDRRFVGWGHEDDAWAMALRTLVGPPWRGDADLVHLWHPPQARQSRRIGNPESLALVRRYEAARNRPDRMRSLIEEIPWPITQ